MEIALYRGKSLVSLLIRWISRGAYSHSAFRLDAHSEQIAYKMQGRSPFKRLHIFAEGSVVEAWKGGVKNSICLATLHSPGTPVDIFSLKEPLTDEEELTLLAILDSQIGEPYSYLNVLRFITRRPGDEDGSWFCSEQVAQDFMDIRRPLFERTQSWEVPPHWIPRSLALKFDRSITTM